MSEVTDPRLRRGVFTLLAVLTVVGLIGTALSPYLLVEHPLLLVLASPGAHHVALAAASVDPLPLITVATVRRVLFGLGTFGLGYLYGRAALGWLEQRYPRLWRIVSWIERIFTRFGLALVVVAPVPTVALLAGAARGAVLPFLLALTVGHAFWNSVTYFVGDAFAVWTDLLTSFIGENLLETTLACVAVVGVQQALSRLLAARRRAVETSRAG